VAKSYGVSSVWFGKACRQLNVPVPPRGYWARVRSGGKGKKPRLTQFIRMLRPAPPFSRRMSSNRRTNTDPNIGQTASRVSDRSRYRKLVGKITL
jgi:hypothetical protein